MVLTNKTKIETPIFILQNLFTTNLVVRKGIEPLLPGRKPGVLTPRRTDRRSKFSPIFQLKFVARSGIEPLLHG